MQFTEDTDEKFTEKLKTGRTGHFSEKDSRNMQRQKPREWQTEARAYWRERDRCG